MKLTIDEIIRRYRFMDDLFMSAVFDDNIEDTQLILRIILGKNDLNVIKVTAQHQLNNLRGRSVRLDIIADDSEGKKYDIEVQRADKGAVPKRARYNLSLLDGYSIKKNTGFEALPETYVIFITENDVMKKGLPIYHIERVVTETGELFDDMEHIIYVNGANEEDSELGRLMHDFRQSDPSEMYYKQLAETARSHKEGGGRLKMCKLVEEYVKQELEDERNDLIAEGRAEGRAEGQAEGLINSIKRLLNKMTPDEIIELGFTKEEVAMAQK